MWNVFSFTPKRRIVVPVHGRRGEMKNHIKALSNALKSSYLNLKLNSCYEGHAKCKKSRE